MRSGLWEDGKRIKWLDESDSSYTPMNASNNNYTVSS